MYLDGVIVFSLVVIVMIIWMMVYIYRYAKKHIDIDAKKAVSLANKEELSETFR